MLEDVICLTHLGFCLTAHRRVFLKVRNRLLGCINICILGRLAGLKGMVGKGAQWKRRRSQASGSAVSLSTVPCVGRRAAPSPCPLGEGQWKIKFCSPVGISLTSSQRLTAAWLIACCCCLIPAIICRGLCICSRLRSWPQPRAG